MQGSFNVWTDHKKGHSKVKDLARFKPMQRHLFLYHKMLLFCKKREETSDGHEKSPSYSFKHSLKVGRHHQRFVHESNEIVNIWLYRMSFISFTEGIFCPWTKWKLLIYFQKQIFDILIMKLKTKSLVDDVSWLLSLFIYYTVIFSMLMWPCHKKSASDFESWLHYRAIISILIIIVSVSK